MQRAKALLGATIFTDPSAEPIRGGMVLIEDGKIAAVGAGVQIPESAEKLDCSGCTITAGFWNSHVHFFERKWIGAGDIPRSELALQLAQTLSRYGFTGAFDLSSAWENTRQLRERIESSEIVGPRIRTTGEGLVPPNALPADAVLGIMGLVKTAMPEVTNALEAAAAVRTLLDAGVDGIKLFASSQRGDRLSGKTIEAAVREAHAAGKPVFVHPNTADDVLAAVRGGADIIAHTTPNSGTWDESTIATMKAANVALTPTLALWKFFLRHDRASTQQRVVGTAVEQLRAWRAAGGTILFGTDLGAVDPDPSDEYALMLEAGMNFRDILASLTTTPARQFGVSDSCGRVAPGYCADLAVLEGDPQNGIPALTAVRYTLRDGNIIYASAPEECGR